MALSARELFLIVRAQNQASGVLRKVGADVAGLGAKEQLRARQLANTAKQQAHYTRGLRLQAQQAALAEKYSPAARTAAQNALENDALNLTNRRADAYSRLKQSTIDINALDERRDRVMKSNTQTQMRWASAMEGAQRRNMQAGNDIERLNKELAKNGAVITQSGKHWDEVGKKVQFAAKQYPQAITAQQRLNSQFAKGDAAIQRFNARMAQHTTQGKKIAEENKAIAESQKAIKFDRLQTGVHLLGSMGRQLQLIGGVGAAALGFAANSAAQLNTQATLAATQVAGTVDKVGAQASRNMNAIIRQMQQFPAASSDMASALYDIFSTLNVSGRQGRDILVQVNKAAVAGGLSVKEATAGVLSVLSNFKSIPQTAAGVAVALNRSFAAVRFGRITMQEFSASLQTTAPAAKQAGQSFDNLAGTVAFLTRSLGSSKASVGYARLLQQFTGQKMIEGLHKHGIEVRDAAGHYRQLDQIVADIAQKFPKLASGQQSAQDFFKAMGGTQGTIQASRAFTTLVQNVGGYQDILGKTTGDQNEFKKSFDAMNQTAGVVWARTLNIVKSLWIELGQAALSTIGDLIKPLGEIAQALNGMDKSTKNAIGRFLVLAVAITGLTGIVLSVLSALGGMALIFASLGAGPILLVAGIITGIALAVALVIRNWSKVKPVLMEYWPDIKNAIVSAAKGIQGVLNSLAGIVEGFVGIVVGLLRGDWGMAWSNAAEVVGHFGDLVGMMFRGAGNLVSAYLDAMTHSVQGFVLGLVGVVLIARKVTAALAAIKAGYIGLAAAQESITIFNAAAGGETAGIGFFGSLGKLASGAVGKVRSLGTAFGGLATVIRSGGLGAGIASIAEALGPLGIAGVVIAAGAGIYLLARHFGVFDSQMQKTQRTIQHLHESLQQMGTSGMQVAQGQGNLAAINLAIQQTRSSLKGLTAGTAEYKSQEQALNSLQLQRIQTLQDLQKAQDELNASMGSSISDLASLTRSNAFGTSIGGQSADAARKQLAQLQAEMASGGLSEGAAKTASSLKNQLQVFDQTEGVLSDSIVKYKQLVAEGIDPASDKMKTLRTAILNANRQLVSNDPKVAIRNFEDMSTVVLSVTRALGHTTGRQLTDYLAQLPKSLQKAETLYSKLTGHVMSDPLAHVIFDNKKVDTSLAAFFATTKDKIGSHKFTVDMNKIINWKGKIPNTWLAKFITGHGRLPTDREIKIEMHVVDKASAEANKIKRKIERQQIRVNEQAMAAHQLTRNVQGGASIRPDTSALDAAKRKLDALKSKNIKVHASMNWSPNDPWEKFNAGAKNVKGAVTAAATTLQTGMSTAGTNAGTGFVQAFDAAAANISASGTLTINVFRKAIGAASPAKKFKPAGKDAADGFIKGFSDQMRHTWGHIADSVQRLILKGLDLSGSAKEKAKTVADAYNQAMDTAIQTLKDKWNEIHDLNQQNFGELFQSDTIQTKIDWGAKLSIDDLQKDLSGQLKKFRDFNKSLNELRRKGAPQSLIDQLRQLGPAAQGELDALNGATKKELKKYEHTWKASQKAINQATKQQFKQQLKEWRSQGKAIAAGILMGLRDGQAGLDRYFRHIWQHMIAVTRHHNKSHSPSKLYAQEGQNIMDGLREGLERGARGLSVPMPGVAPAGGARWSQRGSGGGTVIYQTINAHHSESLASTLRKSNFRLKHRNT